MEYGNALLGMVMVKILSCGDWAVFILSFEHASGQFAGQQVFRGDAG